MEEKSGKIRKRGEEAATKCGAKAEAQGEPRRGRDGTFAQQTALAPAPRLSITFYRQPRALRAGKVNVKIKTSEGCSFSGSDMQSNPMPQSLRRKDKRQPLPGLAGQGRTGVRAGTGGARRLGDQGGPGQGGTELLGWRGRAAWGGELWSTRDPRCSALSRALLRFCMLVPCPALLQAVTSPCFPFLPRSQ